MAVTTEQATVYRGGGRRWFSMRAAVKAEAIAIIKRKHPTERDDPDVGGGWHWTGLPRADVLLRRMCRLVRAAGVLASARCPCGACHVCHDAQCRAAAGVGGRTK